MTKSDNMKQYEFNIFEILNKIDEGDVSFYHNLTDEEKKKVPLFVIMKWMAQTKNKTQLLRLNSIVNPLIFNLQKHDGLIWDLLVLSSSGTKKIYKWNKKNKKSLKTGSLAIKVISEYHGISKKDALNYTKMFDLNELVEMAESLGYDDKEIKKLKNEYNR